jgi:type I restriction enzyme S subunit
VSGNYLGISLELREHEIGALGEGSTGQTELSRERLGQLPLLIPPKAVVEIFDSLSIPLRSKATANFEESNTLASIRDTLLPKLISGELRVADAEKLLAESPV